MSDPTDTPTGIGNRGAATRVPLWLDRLAAWSWRLGIVVGAVVAFLWLVSFARVAIVPLLIAILFAAAMRPAANWFERHRVPATIAAGLPMAIAAVVLGLGLWFVADQIHTAWETEAADLEQVELEVERWLMDGPLSLDEAEIQRTEDRARQAITGGIRSVGFEEGTFALTLLGGAALTIVLTLLLTRDGPALWRSTVERMHPSRRDAVHAAGCAASNVLAVYLRGVAITGLVDALLIGLGLWLLGVPLVLPLMVLTAFAAFFPVVGAVLAGAAAALVALVTVSPATALWVIVLAGAVQQVEGNIVLPIIIGREVGTHPSLILISLTAGGAVAGIAGAFLAVPFVLAVSTAVSTFAAGVDRTPLLVSDLASRTRLITDGVGIGEGVEAVQSDVGQSDDSGAGSALTDS